MALHGSARTVGNGTDLGISEGSIFSETKGSAWILANERIKNHDGRYAGRNMAVIVVPDYRL
jgi:hypothetical protein